MKRFLLQGASTRNTIAGIIVTYARAPAMLSVSPPPVAVTPLLGVASAHFGQAAPSAVCVPQFGQNAMRNLLKMTDSALACRSRGRLTSRRDSANRGTHVIRNALWTQ